MERKTRRIHSEAADNSGSNSSTMDLPGDLLILTLIPLQQSQTPPSMNGRKPSEALEFALKLLGMRSHSRDELERKLLVKGFSREDAVKVIETLGSKGVLDDHHFGREFIGSRSKRKPSGKMKLVAELQRKGVPKEVIGTLLKEVDTGELCIQAAEKKLAALHAHSEALRKKKLESFLRNRGFSWQEIRNATDLLFTESGENEPDC
jgi:regulatory protein